MTLSYSMYLTEGLFSIYDLFGQIITVQPIARTNTQLQISNDRLHNGTYIYSVVINGNEIKRDKIIIVK